MTLKKSTRIWIALFAVSAIATWIAHSVHRDLGCLGVLPGVLVFVSAVVLLAVATVAAFRAIVRRLTLRLAFSYFLIGIVPIPLLAMLLCSAAYLLAHQLVATRVRREVTAVAQEIATRQGLPGVRVSNGKIEASDVPWVKTDESAAWAAKLDEPRPVLGPEGKVWLATRRSRNDTGDLALIPVSDSREFLQLVADRTGYQIWVEVGHARQSRSGWQVNAKPPGGRRGELDGESVRPSGSSAPQETFLDGEWVGAVYVEKYALTAAPTGKDKDVMIWGAKTSPRVLASQLFAQGIPGLARIFARILAGLSATLLLVYFVALVTAFVLVGQITRNVNRLTRATQAIARGDFSVRVQSRSKDQIGDLARSFDGMAASIQGLLVETSEKKRMESEIAIARTIQQKLLPEPEAEMPGVSVLGRFQPLAEIGGDYYDYFRMPDGRSAVVVGDVSGHGLPTGLLVAMAKAGLSTLIESGHSGSRLFARLNDLIHRSTDSRNYMTLALVACDPASRRSELTNAGQLAPYRLSGGSVEPIALPSFPLGLSERSDFPSRELDFALGDRLLFVTDGFVEACDTGGDPFGFERLEALLTEHAASDAVELRDAILAAVQKHTGGAPPADDRTLVVLTFR